MTYLLMPADSDTLGLVLLEAGAAAVHAVALRGTVAGDCIERYGSGVVVDEFSRPVFERLIAFAGTPMFDSMRARAISMARAHDIVIGTRKLLKMWDAVDEPAEMRRRTRARKRSSNGSTTVRR